MKLFNEQETQMHLENLNSVATSDWAIQDRTLHRTFKFSDFKTAFKFMTLVADEAEKIDHHPEWCNSYNRLMVELSTHSVCGLTDLDFQLAEMMELISKKLSSEK